MHGRQRSADGFAGRRVRTGRRGVWAGALAAWVAWGGAGRGEEVAAAPVDRPPVGWIALFDGETLFGWQADREGQWRVADGALAADAGEPGFLYATTEFADYELHVEFRAAPQTNSGVFLRVPREGLHPGRNCYELNIAPRDNPFPTGSLVERAKFALDPAGDDPWDGQWHAFDVRVAQGEVQVRLDGRETGRYADPRPAGRGRIALQYREGPIAFRNVLLKPLGLAPIFNGRDLEGWNDARANQSRFTVTEGGELRAENGRGQLESAGVYGDFVLQLECRVDGDGLNSGIFFRCIPGEDLQGYESQIHNGIRDGDPTQPVDCGTGGIFRRQNARRVVARDRQWFAKTIVAEGPHVAVWVDGIQVTDWTDGRAPHENPRKGLRTAAGTLALQGHDPTTDLRFRGLAIAELPPR
jgi:hypothetical protein